MPDITSPETLEEVKSAPSRPSVSAIANSLKAEIIKADASRGEQKKNWERWYKKRMGMRAQKSFPWPGCANVHLPLVDKTIKKMVPLYTSLIDMPGKVGIFRPAVTRPATSAGMDSRTMEKTPAFSSNSASSISFSAAAASRACGRKPPS